MESEDRKERIMEENIKRKYNLKKTRIPIILIILLTMIINTGCLTMQYYPAKVAEPWKMYLGLGFHGESLEGWRSNSMLFAGIFFRYGLPYNFDIGFGMHAVMIFPYMVSINARKQFDFNNDIIHSITFDAGFGISITKVLYTSISLIRNDFALTIGLKKYMLIVFPENSNSYRNEFLIKIANELECKRFNLMPFIYYKAVQEYDAPSIVFYK